jgi:hypothetical protein
MACKCTAARRSRPAAQAPGRLSFVNRRIRPELGIEGANLVGSGFNDLFDAAEQVLTVNGVMFLYSPYALGPRVSPQPILVDFNSLGACFSPQIEQSPSGSM